jgi:hypothetical protein
MDIGDFESRRLREGWDRGAAGESQRTDSHASKNVTSAHCLLPIGGRRGMAIPRAGE